MKFGRFEVSLHNFGMFRLDGGAMFGSVPKNLWNQRIAADSENCIPLATRSLLIRDTSRTFLVDVGMGEKWGDKQRAIFAIQNTPESELGFDPASVTDVILTHLHFDHAGGISRYTDDSKKSVTLSYPKATIWIQGDNVTNAKKPTLKERASYLPENVDPVVAANPKTVRGSTEIYPGIWVHQVDGHSVGQQWIEVRDGKRSIVYPTDLIPTSHHLPVPFHMGYDQCATQVLNEKEPFLANVLSTDSIIVFQHDPKVGAATIKKDDKGHYAVKEVVAF